MLISRSGQRYLVTAAHLVQKTDGNPLVQIKDEWVNVNWTLVGASEDADIAALIAADESRLPSAPSPHYADPPPLMHQPALALGFPGGMPEPQLARSPRGGYPIPIATPLTLYSNPGYIKLAAGFINHGYSGGAIIARSGILPTIIGVIIEKSLLPDGQHAGLIRYAPISAAERIIARAAGDPHPIPPPLANPYDPDNGPIIPTPEMCAALLKLGSKN